MGRLLGAFRLAVLASFLTTAHASADAMFMGLGDLPGGGFFSIPRAVSADGAVVVGVSGSSDSDGNEAFRWTESAGIVGLGDLIGGAADSLLVRSTADGSLAVGYATSSQGHQASRWSQSGG